MTENIQLLAEACFVLEILYSPLSPALVIYIVGYEEIIIYLYTFHLTKYLCNKIMII